MKGMKIWLPLIILTSLLVGFMFGKSMDRMTLAIRKAQDLANKGIPEKKKAVEILTKQKALLDYSFKYAQTARELQIISISLANILIKYEMWNDALTYLEISRQILPNDFAVHYNAGLVNYNLQKLEKSPAKKDLYYRNAIDSLENALKLEPDSVDSLYLLGLLMYENKLHTDALGYFARVLEQYPDEPNTLFALGRLYFDIGELEKSRKVYLKIESLLPRNSQKMDQVEKNLQIINRALQKAGGL